MSLDSRPGPHEQQDFGSLDGCFVEGSPEQRARERRIRRRSLIISVAVQAAILAAIVLVPLFGKPERIAFANMMPIPPYVHSSQPHSDSQQNQIVRRHPQGCASPCYNLNAPNSPIPTTNEPDDNAPPDIPGAIEGGARGTGGEFLGLDSRPQPVRPADLRPGPPKRLVVTHLEPAALLQRVEPGYPALAKQIHREGRVELHAIIATDGTIQALQVVSGDAIFIQSTLDAVRQWRYRPTVLNGQPVEIETYITVVFTLQH